MRAFCEPLEASGVELVYRRVEPAIAYPFPWSVSAFFGQFPETFLEEGVDIDFEPPEGDFDLVIVASQVWFLKPSPPFCRLLSRHPALFAGRRVLTLVACRNMWIRGWGRLAERIREAGGDITDRVVAVHSGSVLASYFTTLAWMLTGKRDALKPLGKAEIAAQTVERVRGLGERFASGDSRMAYTENLTLKAHPGAYWRDEGDPELFHYTLEFTFRHVLWEGFAHLRTIQAHKQAMGLPAVNDLPEEGYLKYIMWE